MTLQVARGSFSVTTGGVGSTVSVTDVGFQGKVLILWWTQTTSTADVDVSAVGTGRGIGIALSSSSRRCFTAGTNDADNMTTINQNFIRDDSCVTLFDFSGTGTPAIDGILDFLQWTSNGFELTVDNQFTINFTVHYLVLGGTDIANTALVSYATATATAPVDQDITTIGFQPDFAFVVTRATTAAYNTGNSGNSGCVGASSDPSTAARQYYISVRENNAVNTDSCAAGRAGQIVALGSGTTGASGMVVRAAHTAWLSSGLRLNYPETNTTARQGFILAVNGGAQWFVDNLLTRTDGDNIVESGFGFSPSAGMFFSVNRAETADDGLTSGDNLNISLGGFASASNRSCIANFSDGGVATTLTDIGQQFDAVYQNVSADALQGLMDIATIDSDGFTCVMDDTDPSQAWVGYWAVGPASVTTYPQTLAATSTFTAAMTPATIFVRALAVTSTFTAAMTQALVFARTLAVTSAFTPAIVKMVGLTLAVTSAFAVTMATALLFQVALAATSTFTAALTRAVTFLQTLAATSAFVAALSSLFIPGEPPAEGSSIHSMARRLIDRITKGRL